jgi:hypothetical protein
MSCNAVSFRHLQDNPHSLIQEADSYFDSLELGVSGELDPNIQDSDGLVSYIVATTNPPPAEIKSLYDEIVPVMEGFIDVLVSSVLKIAGDDDLKKHDPAIWKKPIEAIFSAFFGGLKIAQQSYDKKIVGVEIPTTYLNILMEASVSEEDAWQSFGTYLSSEGETMRALAIDQGNEYLYAIVSIVHDIFQAADRRWIYVPKFKIYFTKFSRETFKLTRACDSKDKFRFKFALNVMIGTFMVETWKHSPDFQKNVHNFIKKYKQTSIKDSENYFEGMFESTQE